MKTATRIIALGAAALITLGLASCGMRGTDTAPGTETNNSSLNGTGQVGDLNQDEIGNGDGVTDSNMETQARTRRSALRQRTAYDYLNDGKYRAGENGKVSSRGSELGKDLTQGARDLIRDARELGRDMAGDVDNGVRDAGRAVRNAENRAQNSVRDKLT